MKVAILTHPLGTNYGGILQNYALQQVLKNLGHQPVTLNYQFEIPRKTKILSWGGRLLQRLRGKKIPLRVWTTPKEHSIITQYTGRFIRKHINVTDSFFLDKIQEIDIGRPDAIVVGSDQVWRGSHPDVSHFFLRDFDGQNIKKVAYAASFGVNFWEYSKSDTELCKRLVQQFKAVSVRENGGVNLCKKYFEITPQLVLDPTLLLKCEDYDTLVNIKQIGDKRTHYIMTYVLDKTPAKMRMIEKVSQSLGLLQKTVMVDNYFNEVGKKGLESCIYPPVEDWIRGFRDADFVVTDSFHGTVFSILYHKPFVSFVNKYRGADRFISLLSILHLEERLVDREEEVLSLIRKPIDYVIVDSLLQEKREESLEFLKNSLQ
jgi:hypothetical protein